MRALDLVVVGGGGHAREVFWLASQSNQSFRLLGFLDDARVDEPTVNGVKHLGAVERCIDYAHASFVVAVGAPRVRRDLVQRLQSCGIERFATLIHPSATIGSGVSIGAGSQICAGVRITTDVHIGDHVIVNQNCTIAHDCHIANLVTLAPMVALSGNVHMEDGAEMGTGAVVHQGVTARRGAAAGMGTVVLKDIDADELVIGNPARRLRTQATF
ncbi:MAG: acetyltransferase [Gammaproteobacteria bacterium]